MVLHICHMAFKAFDKEGLKLLLCVHLLKVFHFDHHGKIKHVYLLGLVGGRSIGCLQAFIRSCCLRKNKKSVSKKPAL